MSIRMSAFYAVPDGGRFDFDYYAQHHVPMVYDLLADFGCRSISVDRGVSGGPGERAPYAVIGQMEFDSIEGFQAGLKEHGRAILADVPKFTDATPITQVSEVLTALP
jgi:uncharacterized protein (TIGR02118 family)